MRQGFRLFALLLIVLASLGALVRAMSIQQPATAFVTMAASDLSALESQMPYIHIATETDISGRTNRDVTTGNFGGCGNMDNTGVSGNSDEFDCMMAALGANENLYFPDGTYDFEKPLDNNSVYRPTNTFDNRGIVCESRAAILLVTTDHTNQTNLMEGEDTIWIGADRVWNGGAGGSRGDTVLPLTDTSGLASGDWVRVRADANSIQDFQPKTYYVKVDSVVGSTSITIDRPLPLDFNGGNAVIREWDPTENFVLENCTLAKEQPDHQVQHGDWLLRLKNFAGGHIKNVHFTDGYHTWFRMDDVARLLITRSDFTDLHWDKPTNGYGVLTARTSDVTFFDSHMHGAPQLYDGTDGVVGTVFAFMDMRGPVVNALFDRGCNEAPGNSCVQVAHGHPLHCSSQQVDIDGDNGDASCRGTPADVVSGSGLFHDSAGSATVFIRSYLEPQVWNDFRGGPGRYNMVYGSTLYGNGAISADGATGEPGDFVFKTEADGNLPSGFRQNWRIWNTTLRDLGLALPSPGGQFNRLGDDVQIRDSVIRGQCVYNNNDAANSDGGACTSDDSATDPGVNTIFANNTVGSSAHPGGYSRTMPSAPGFTDWPDWGFTPTGVPPFVGPEMGDPSTAANCLPAAERFYSGCP